MEKPASHFYEFDSFLLDARNHILYKAGEPVPVPRKSLELLTLLARNCGRVLDKEVLFSALWPDTVVEDANLTQTVYVLRKALEEKANRIQYIETVPRRGYRFNADVRIREGPPDYSDDRPSHTAPPRRGEVARAGSGDSAGPRGVAEPTANGVRPRAPSPALRVLLALAVGLPLVAFLVWALKSRAPEPSVVTINSVAILPFRTVGDGAEVEHLGLGMTDTLITRLSGLKRISVRPTSAVVKYSGAASDPLAAGRELGVDAVMDGTVQREGDSVRITVRLIRLDGGQPIWAGKFDEQFTNVFALQDAISEQVADHLQLALSDEQRQSLVKRNTANAEAYQAYAEGLFFWNKRTREGLAKAIDYFKRAVEIDPKYALAFAALSDSYCLSAYYGYDFVPRETAVAQARLAAARAIALDETLAESHLAVAMVSQKSEKEMPVAEYHFKRAIELNPFHATVRQRYGWFLLMAGRLEEGLDEMRRSRESDPVSPINCAALSAALIFARRYDEAIDVSRRLLEIEPESYFVRFNLADAYGHKGMYDEAIAEIQRLRKGNRDGDSSELEALAFTYALAGRRGEAERTLRELLAGRKGGRVSAYNVALVYAALGRKDAAFAWLEKSLSELDDRILFFMYDPHLDLLRSDPRFEPFLRRHGLGQSLAGARR
jgi:DNA-binding winged helix-turn-helix (wHTH) protein/TolB-like protein/thioredoxin-like negative regulator of GroEL